MLPRTGSFTHLIVGTLLAVSTAVVTQSNPACVFRSIKTSIGAMDIHLQTRDFGRPSVLFNRGVKTDSLATSLCDGPRQ